MSSAYKEDDVISKESRKESRKGLLIYFYTSIHLSHPPPSPLPLHAIPRILVRAFKPLKLQVKVQIEPIAHDTQPFLPIKLYLRQSNKGDLRPAIEFGPISRCTIMIHDMFSIFDPVPPNQSQRFTYTSHVKV